MQDVFEECYSQAAAAVPDKESESQLLVHAEKCREQLRDMALVPEDGSQASQRLLEVDAAGDRSRVLEICSKQYRAYFESGLISNTACAALDHITQDAVFRCGSELQ